MRHILREDCLISVSSLVLLKVRQPCLASQRRALLVLALLGVLRDLHRLVRRQVGRQSAAALPVVPVGRCAILLYLLSLQIGIFNCAVLVGLPQSFAELDLILLWLC